MGDFLQVFGQFTVGDTIIFLAAIGFVIGCVIKAYKFVVKYHDEIQDKQANFDKLAKSIDSLMEHQGQIKEEVIALRKVQEDMLEWQQQMEKQSKEQQLNSLRDRLLQSYNYYGNEIKNPEKAWSEMEKEAFDELFKDYERLGGNGFMHSTVRPKMSGLEVIPMTETERISDLMRSRA